jgi:tetratricopeptide (TPR) repeat protein
MDQEIRRNVTLGKESFENKDYLRAEKYFREVLKKRPHFADIYNMLGLIYHEQGKFSKALLAFEKSLDLNPNYTEASLNLSVTYNDLGQYKKAKEIYNKAKKISQRDTGELDPYIKGKLANMHAETADVYRSIRMYPEAVSEYKNSLILRHKYVDIKTKLADTYRDQGDFEMAIKEYLDAKKISKEYYQIGVNLGIAFYSAGKISKATEEWKNVLDKDPANKSAKMYLRLVEASKERAEKSTKGKKPSKK